MPVNGDDISPQKNSAKAGPLLMLGSAFSFSLFDILIKLLGPGFTVWDIAFYRFGAGLLLSALIVGFRRDPLSLHNKRLLMIRGSSAFQRSCVLQPRFAPSRCRQPSCSSIRFRPLPQPFPFFFSGKAFRGSKPSVS